MPSTTNTQKIEESGKQVSFVELYLDLVFVLAVGELARLIVDEPRLHTVWVTLGLFVALWWTWVGFTVLYNRHGADDGPQRALFLAASMPAGAAAVAVGPASHGHIAAFAVSLATTRVLLALGHARDDDPDTPVGDDLRRRTACAYVLSAGLFTASIWVPQPLSYLLWAVAWLHESRVMLADDPQRGRVALSQSDSGTALDAHHFAERFGLFMIILLGQVVVEAGEAAADGRSPSAATWSALVAAIALAGALWWTYFDAASEIDLNVLRVSGGSASVARTIFAAGHMIPAFALIVTAAGVGLLLHHDPSRIAYWLACVGCGLYLAGTRAYMRASGKWRRTLRCVALAATFALGTLHSVLAPSAYLWVLAGWVAADCALTVATTPPQPS